MTLQQVIDTGRIREKRILDYLGVTNLIQGCVQIDVSQDGFCCLFAVNHFGDFLSSQDLITKTQNPN